MALRTRVWSAGKLFVLGGALVGTYLLFAAASMRLAIRAREVQVPDLANRTANEATAIATDSGLTVRRRRQPAARSEDPASAACWHRTRRRDRPRGASAASGSG